MAAGQKIYVTGPIMANSQEEIETNFIIACRVAGELVYKGHYPYLPHVMCNGLIRFCEGTYQALDDFWLKQCEALFFIAPSPMADRELARAKDLGLKIYNCLDEVEEVTR